MVVAAGFAIRMLSLDAGPFWVDEAESSINALTILQKGYPTDVYLGLPIYENTLVRTWPENAEYEFRDVSYSDRHFAVYHGWLPLYLIAASFALNRVQPDEEDGSRTVKHDLGEQKRRTRSARLPGVLVGSIFLLIAFAGGRALYGREAGWAALIVGFIYPYHIQLSRQARYYSLQVALTTLCCVMLWLLLTRCRWKDIYLSAFGFVMLFHTHLLSFCTAAVIALLMVPFIVRRHGLVLPKLAVFAALVGSGTLPWVIVTGIYRHRAHIPGAWAMLEMPGDLWRYPPLKLVYVLAGLAIVSLAVWVILCRQRLPSRLTGPIVELAPVLLYLSVWVVCGYSLFLRFMPAASFAPERLNLVYWGPGFLLASVIAASLSRLATPRSSIITAPAIAIALFFATGHKLDLRPQLHGGSWDFYAAIFDRLNAMRLDGVSRLYAGPNDHLIYSFYSGLPVQNIFPVRKSFLDSYRGEIVYIDVATAFDGGALSPERVRQEAFRSGQTLTPEAAKRWSLLLRTRDYREEMGKALAPGRGTKLESLPPFAGNLLKQEPDPFSEWARYPLFKGFEIRTWADWRTIFQYRFVDPAAHSGPLANYAERLRGSTAMILPLDGVLYRSRWHPPGACDGVTFQFVP
jgi:hypothetical protein